MARRVPTGRVRTGGARTGSGDADGPSDNEVARRRSSASKLCSVSLYASISAPLAWCIAGPFTTGPFALLAVICGIVGLVRLRNLPPPPVDAAQRAGLVRLSTKMAETAPIKAYVGIALGALSLLFSIAIVLFVGAALIGGAGLPE